METVTEPSGRLIACDLVCMGVGSPGVWQGFRRWLEERAGAPLASYRHRPKTLAGEVAANPPELAVFSDGSELQGTRASGLWRRLYGGCMALRPSCHACAYHSTRRSGDATIGDFWGLGRFSGFADERGTSLAMVSAEGETAAELRGVLAGAMLLEQHTPAEAANPEQPMLREPKPPAAGRGKLFAAFSRGGFPAVARRELAGAVARKGRRLLAKVGVKVAEPAAEGDAAAVVAEPVELPSGGRLSNRMLAAKGDCCGCTACMAACPTGAISMVEDAEGFKYPAIDEEACVGCGRCERACGYKRALAEPECVGPTDEPLVFAAKHRSDEVRMRSSSGGAFWALAEHVIGRGGVVYGCAFDAEFVARHVRCETLAECEACQGSKYSQSDMGRCFTAVRDDLRAGRLVLFTGTPCQVHGLRTYLETCGGGGQLLSLLLCADLVCHGVPSPLLFREHLAFLRGRQGSVVSGYQHRPKDLGWGHVEKVAFADGTSQQNTRLANSWRNTFYGNRGLRPGCYHCPYTQTRRSGDVTIADFWGIEATDLAGFRDDLGVSLVLANTRRGRELMAGGLALETRASTLADALPKNPMLRRPSVYEGNRAELWRLYRTRGYKGMVRKLRYYPSALRVFAGKAKRKLKAGVKRVLGRA